MPRLNKRTRVGNVCCTRAEDLCVHLTNTHAHGSNTLFSSVPRTVQLRCKSDQELGFAIRQWRKVALNRISTASFSFNFNQFSCEDCLSLFRFEKNHVPQLSQIAGWPEQKTCTERNRFRVTPFLAACILLRRIACPFRWRDVEEMLEKSASHLSDF